MRFLFGFVRGSKESTRDRQTENVTINVVVYVYTKGSFDLWVYLHNSLGAAMSRMIYLSQRIFRLKSWCRNKDSLFFNLYGDTV